ncbi:MAG: molecular chaperone HtpG, partial [Bacteroidales bacterium]|nr:molecular chaperone HtpG [Bacteroidales bacterium]
FLTLLHGVIDSPDIPLNVSRSYLQSDSNVKKISGHIMKKVSDKLEELFKENREEFEKKWDDIKVFIQYGMISEPKFYEKGEKFSLFKNTEGKYFTFEEYRKHVEAAQKDKEGKLVYLYSTDVHEQHAYINAARERGYDVLEMNGVLDNHFINTLEQKMEKTSFTRVDADILDKIIKKEDEAPSKLSEDDKNKLKPVFEKYVEKENYHVVFENLSETDLPVMITQPEFMRRMKDMSKLGGYDYMGTLPDSYNLVINTNHKLISRLLEETDEDRRDNLTRQLTDLARLSQNLLKGAPLTDFIKRSVNMIE